MRHLLALLGAGALAALPVIANASATSGTSRAERAADTPYVGCCSDPDVQNFGYHVEFDSWPDGEEISDQLRSVGLLFGRSVNDAANAVPWTYVLSDPSRSSQCTAVLNGEPAFTGWEYFIFVSPVENKWATVQKVGVDVGYCDRERTTFLAAYDMNGNLIASKYNDRVGFEFLSVQRPTADIARVLVGDCDGAYCYQDDAGSALNCLTFSGPVATNTPLPTNIRMPNPPLLQGVPGAGLPGWIALTLGLAGIAAAALRGVGKPRREA